MVSHNEMPLYIEENELKARFCSEKSLPAFIEDQEVRERLESQYMSNNELYRSMAQLASTSYRGQLVATLFNLDAILFYVTIFMVGVCSHVYYSFFYIQLKEDGIADQHVGLFVAPSYLSSLLVTPFSQPIIRRMGGPLSMLTISLGSYIARFLGYILVCNPWYYIFFQALNAISHSLFVAAYVEHSFNIAPTELKTTLVMLAMSTYYSLSGIVGNLAGGVIYQKYGSRKLFAGLTVIISGWLLVMIIYTCVQKRKKVLQPKDELVEKNDKISSKLLS